MGLISLRLPPFVFRDYLLREPADAGMIKWGTHADDEVCDSDFHELVDSGTDLIYGSYKSRLIHFLG